VLAASLDGANVKTLRETVDQLKNKLGAAAVVLASSDNGKVSIIAGVTKAESERIRAGDLANLVARKTSQLRSNPLFPGSRGSSDIDGAYPGLSCPRSDSPIYRHLGTAGIGLLQDSRLRGNDFLFKESLQNSKSRVIASEAKQSLNIGF
jgi:hypothetical protein